MNSFNWCKRVTQLHSHHLTVTINKLVMRMRRLNTEWQKFYWNLIRLWAESNFQTFSDVDRRKCTRALALGLITIIDVWFHFGLQPMCKQLHYYHHSANENNNAQRRCENVKSIEFRSTIVIIVKSSNTINCSRTIPMGKQQNFRNRTRCLTLSKLLLTDLIHLNTILERFIHSKMQCPTRSTHHATVQHALKANSNKWCAPPHPFFHSRLPFIHEKCISVYLLSAHLLKTQRWLRLNSFV